MTENKNHEKFVTLAEKRVTRAIKDLRLVGNLSNRSNYRYTDDDVRKITRALDRELKSLKRRFHVKGEAEEVVFKL